MSSWWVCYVTSRNSESKATGNESKCLADTRRYGRKTKNSATDVALRDLIVYATIQHRAVLGENWESWCRSEGR